MTAKVLPVDSFSPEELARLARLQYVLDEEAGFARQTNGSGFYYLNGNGRRLRDPQQIKRIETLAIPPAWTDVWICRMPTGHLQATGRDVRGRKQYIYHEHWREISNLAKFLRLTACPRFLPDLRRQVSRDLRGRELTRTRVLAGMVALLDLTSIRIGNEEYVRENGSYGLATLRTRHVTIEGGRATVRFRAKAGLRREVVVEDKRLVRLLMQLKKLRGAHVFQYVDEAGQIHSADAIAVNDYLRDCSGYHFTAKDFRTWKASALATSLLHDQRSLEKLAARKRVAKSVVAAVADTLGNTAPICRKYYIHPGLMDAYLDGQFPQIFHRFHASRQKSLTPSEQLFARFLRHSWHRGC
jgi:DNA topoisomerase-1